MKQYIILSIKNTKNNSSGLPFFYGSDKKGYVHSADKAGGYSEEEALEICGNLNEGNGTCCAIQINNNVIELSNIKYEIAIIGIKLILNILWVNKTKDIDDFTEQEEFSFNSNSWRIQPSLSDLIVLRTNHTIYFPLDKLEWNIPNSTPFIDNDIIDQYILINKALKDFNDNWTGWKKE